MLRIGKRPPHPDPLPARGEREQRCLAFEKQTGREDMCIPQRTRGEVCQPRPTNGIWFAIIVMNSTLVESGRFAM
jgi:hypothetical protein